MVGWLRVAKHVMGTHFAEHDEFGLNLKREAVMNIHPAFPDVNGPLHLFGAQTRMTPIRHQVSELSVYLLLNRFGKLSVLLLEGLSSQHCHWVA